MCSITSILKSLVSGYSNSNSNNDGTGNSIDNYSDEKSNNGNGVNKIV